MKANIRNLIASNPSGLLELQPSLSIPEYRENMGFDLKNTCTIYESKKSHYTAKDWYKFPRVQSLSELFEVKSESEGDLLVVFIVETINRGRVYCHLVLTDQAFADILSDGNQHVLKVHQMYTKFWEDNIAINQAISC